MRKTTAVLALILALGLGPALATLHAQDAGGTLATDTRDDHHTDYGWVGLLGLAGLLGLRRHEPVHHVDTARTATSTR